MHACALDALVSKAVDKLSSEGLEPPSGLFLLPTGSSLLAGRLERSRSVPLAEVDSMPRRWMDVILHGGRIGGTCVWVAETAEEEADEEEPPWSAGLPCWIAAVFGARSLVLAAAGSSLPAPTGTEQTGPPVGTFTLVRDHINLSGSSPLVGLGESRLGPLFPDLTRLHDPSLRQQAMETARRLGLSAREVVAACTAGPSLETPAERQWYARAGGEVSCQNLAAPLLAAAHAGLRALAIVTVIDAGERPSDLARIASAADWMAPALEDLLLGCVPALAEHQHRLESL
jgi:purine-nucleoside phosphorylase